MSAGSARSRSRPHSLPASGAWLTELEIKDIWVKAMIPEHGRIAQRIGAHHVVYPEADMGKRVAHLMSGRMMDYMEFEDGFAIAKTHAPAMAQNRTLAESRVREHFDITVVGVKRLNEVQRLRALSDLSEAAPLVFPPSHPVAIAAAAVGGDGVATISIREQRPDSANEQPALHRGWAQASLQMALSGKRAAGPSSADCRSHEA